MTDVRRVAECNSGSRSDAVVRWVVVTNLSGLEKRNIFLANERYLVEKALRGNKHAAGNCRLGKGFLG